MSRGVNNLVDLCIELAGANPQDLHYELDICTASDSLVVRKMLNSEQIDVQVSSLCDSGAAFLISWIYAEEAREAK